MFTHTSCSSYLPGQIVLVDLPTAGPHPAVVIGTATSGRLRFCTLTSRRAFQGGSPRVQLVSAARCGLKGASYIHAPYTQDLPTSRVIHSIGWADITVAETIAAYLPADQIGRYLPAILDTVARYNPGLAA